jgi:DNA repair protein RadC
MSWHLVEPSKVKRFETIPYQTVCDIRRQAIVLQAQGSTRNGSVCLCALENEMGANLELFEDLGCSEVVRLQDYRKTPLVNDLLARFSEDEILMTAAEILVRRTKTGGDFLSDPRKASEIAKLRLGTQEHEIFGVFWVDAQNRLIDFEEMFRGTLTCTSVYPREVVKAALRKNAAGCVVTHNHPSGSIEPSQADRMLTDQLKSALGMVDVKVLDHIIVSGNLHLSFADRGWI